MPIANCVIHPSCRVRESSDLIALWAEESNVSPEHMTVNISFSEQQLGCQYAVMANLYLPSMWSESSIVYLQLGLAKALARHFCIAPKEVFVMTSIIDSGHVVEEGKIITW